jgi:outer membrane protein assembly factor BamB
MRHLRANPMVAALLCAVCMAWPCPAQTINPVYVDDSPAATDTLLRAPELAASGNTAEAVRALQRILEEEPDRVAPDAGPGAEADVFTGVRRRVHLALLSDPDLLAEYRQGAQPRAADLLAAGDFAKVEQSYLLTSAGFRAALRLAQVQMESAAFESARLTLEQLEDHPDRAASAPAEPRRDGAVLLRRLAAYIDRPEVWDRAERWCAAAGVAPESRRAIPAPPGASVPSLTPLDALDARPLEANIPPTALWSVSVEDRAPTASPEDDARSSAGARAPARNDQRLWIFPTVVDDTLLLNNGTTIRAWDRFTLESRWAVQPPTDPSLSPEDIDFVAEERQARRPSQRQDTATVTVAGSIVLATTGLAIDGLRFGDDRVHGLDLGTGRILWSAAPWTIDPQLEDASVRGPVLAGESLAVVSVRKSVQPRRVISVYLVGLDLRTGAQRWARLIASAGALPNQRDSRVADSGVLEGGVVYSTDPVGVVAAVEASTGRPVWVRRVPSMHVNYIGGPAGQLWESSAPVVWGDSVFVLSTDRDAILHLDRATGRLRAARAGGAFAEPGPRYILGVGGTLVAVGRDRLAFLDMDDFQSGTIRLSDKIDREGGIRGRVVAAAGVVVVPTIDGARIIDPSMPTPMVAEVPLDKPGTLLPVGDQIVAVDDREIHSYLGWEAADRLLTARMASDPDDPRPAVSYADLAYRAARPDRIAPAADRALAAIEKAPATEVNEASRSRLFASLREMIESAEDSWSGIANPGPPPLPPATVEALVVRLGRAAASHHERVIHLLCLGRLHEARGSPAMAVEAYQAILADSALAQSDWAILSPTAAPRRAGEEASLRLRSLVISSGRSVYSAFDAEVETELAGLVPDRQSGPALESLVRKYPVARAATRIWELAADAYARAGDARGEVAALGAALDAAEMGMAIGPAVAAPGALDAPEDPAADLGRAAGRLVRAVQRSGRPETAAHTLARIRAAWQDVPLTDGIGTLDVGAVASELQAAMAGPVRHARIGTDVGPQDQQFPDWALLRPLDPAAPVGSAEHVLMVSEARSEIALFGVDFGPDAGSTDRGRLRKLWSRVYEEQAPALLRSDAGAVYLAWLIPDGGELLSIERIDVVGGATRWRTPRPVTLLPADETLARRLTDNGSVTRLETHHGPRPITQIITLIDRDWVALVERTGRIVILDAATGEPRARAVSPVGAVFDATCSGGMLALAGAERPPRNVQEEPPPVVAAYRLSTGELLRTFADLKGQVRWVRFSPRGDLLLAHPTEVVARDIATGAEAWDMPCAEARDAWIFDTPELRDSIFLLTDPNRELFRGSLVDGSVGDGPIETSERLEGLSRIDAVAVDGRIALMNSRGVVLLTPDGQVAGMNALDASEAMTQPVAAAGSFLGLDTREVILPDGRPTYRLNLWSTGSIAAQAAYDLVLWQVPTRIAVVDGRILVTAGRMTVGYPAGE